MDEVIRQLVSEFADERGLTGLDVPEQFEVFAGHCVFSQYTYKPFDAAEYRIGGGGDGGIDGYVVVIDENLFNSPEPLDEYLAGVTQVSPQIVVVQAKTEHKTSRTTIANLRVRIDDILHLDRVLDNAEDAEPLRDCLRVIYSRLDRLSPEGVRLTVYYVNTALPLNDELRREADRTEQALSDTEIVGTAKFTCLGRRELHELHDRSQWSSSGTLTFKDCFNVPAGSGISQAQFGMVSAEDLMALLSDSEGVLKEELFNENVRGYQLQATVNEEIRETLRDEHKRSEFPVLNNGVTILARTMWTLGKSRVAVRDYQVVNGCQTCHVLNEERDNLDGVFVTVRIVECETDEVVDRVILATNRQTAIPKEYIVNRVNLMRRLDVHYRRQRVAGYPLYFQLRPGNGPKSLRRNVVSLRAQLNAFIAMFTRRSPIRSHPNLDAEFANLFKDVQPQEMYTAAAALYRWDWLVENGRINSRYRQLGYQAIAALGVLERLRPFSRSAKDKKKRLADVDSAIWSDGHWERLSHSIQEILDQALEQESFSDFKSAASSTRFADAVVKLARNHPQPLPPQQGTLSATSPAGN